MTENKMTKDQMMTAEAKRARKEAIRDEMLGTKARRLRIFPSKAQKLQLTKAFEACRWVYNRCVEEINKQSRARKGSMTKKLRSMFVNVDAWEGICKGFDSEWSSIPYEVRDGALRDAVKAVDSTDAAMDAKAAKENKEHGIDWEFKFRRKKDITESLQLRYRNLNSRSLWFALLFGTPADRSAMVCHRALPKRFTNDVRLLHDKRLERYYIIVAVPPKPEPELGDDSQVPAHLGTCDMDIVGGK